MDAMMRNLLLQAMRETEYAYEVRRAKNGKVYSASEFLQYYGEGWVEHWEKAARVAPGEMAKGMTQLLKALMVLGSLFGNFGAEEKQQWGDQDPGDAMLANLQAGMQRGMEASSKEKSGLQSEADQWVEPREAQTLAGPHTPSPPPAPPEMSERPDPIRPPPGLTLQP